MFGDVPQDQLLALLPVIQYQKHVSVLTLCAAAFGDFSRHLPQIVADDRRLADLEKGPGWRWAPPPRRLLVRLWMLEQKGKEAVVRGRGRGDCLGRPHSTIRRASPAVRRGSGV